jgi:glycerol-3-phosphate dehydrogenase
VRPLVDDASSNASTITRDYRLELDTQGAPLLSVFGGKLTTFRKLAEEVVDKLAPALHMQAGPWTANACLPGGDLFGARPGNRAVLEFDDYVRAQQETYDWLPSALVARYARAYGTRIARLLAGKVRIDDMGEEVAPGLYAAEIAYLIRNEWARDAADILWRRSKLGLHLPNDTQQKLDAWMQARPQAAQKLRQRVEQ